MKRPQRNQMPSSGRGKPPTQLSYSEAVTCSSLHGLKMRYAATPCAGTPRNAPYAYAIVHVPTQNIRKTTFYQDYCETTFYRCHESANNICFFGFKEIPDF